MTAAEFRRIALEFPGVETTPHFERTGFRVTGRRMFATLLDRDGMANIFLDPAEQAAFCKMGGVGVFPVPNKWGEKGATTFKLETVDEAIVCEALFSAHSATLVNKK